MAGYLPQELAIEFVLERRVFQASVDQVLNGTEVVLDYHRFHGSGEVELEVLEEILGLCIEGAGGKGGESLMETARGPVEHGVFPVGVITRIDRLILHDL